MRNSQNIIFMLIVLLVVQACSDNEEDALTLGNVFNNTESNIYYTDTITINASTILLDSFNTDGYNTVLIGYKEDDIFGTIKGRSYIPISIGDDYPSIDDEATFDSLVLVLTPNTEYFGDTLLTRKLEVYEVLDTITPNDDGYFYTNTTFTIDDEPLISESFDLRPLRQEQLFFKFPDEMGQTWFNSIIDEDDETFESTSDFQELFKGLAIIPADSSSSWSASFYGETTEEIDDEEGSLQMRLYYTLKNAEENTYYTFETSNSDYIYTHYETNREGVVTDIISEDNTEVASSVTDNNVYMQSGAGLAVKISIPLLSNINVISSNLTLINAELIVKPKLGTYDSDNPLPTTFYVNWADKNNNSNGSLYDISSSDIIYGTLYEDEEFPENTYYSFSIFSYMMLKINSTAYIDDNLMLLFDSETLATSFSSLVLEDNDANSESMYLKLYYMSY